MNSYRYVVGFDPSTTSAGVSVFPLTNPHGVRLHRIKSEKDGDSLVARVERQKKLCADVNHVIPDGSLVLMEGPSFASKGSALHMLAGNWWLLAASLRDHGHDVVEVTPSSRMKYATGNGNAHKDQVLAAVIRRYGELAADVDGNDKCDAFVFGAIGMRQLGFPLEESLPKVNLDAMKAIDAAFKRDLGGL